MPAKFWTSGWDPGTERKAARLTAKHGGSRSFQAIARKWHSNQCETWVPVNARTCSTFSTSYVFPIVGNMDIDAITAPQVVAILREIENRPARETAHRVRQRMDAIFGFAIAEGIGTVNPAALVQKALKPVIRGKQPAGLIELPELVTMLRKCEDECAHPVTKGALRFIALTLARPGNIQKATWAQMDLDGNSPKWSVSAEDMKMDRPWVCPISGPALDVLRALQPLTGRGSYIFPNARHGHKPMSENAIGYLLNRAGYHHRHCAHGFRASFSSIMNQKHAADHDAIESQLAHVTGGVRGAYMRAPFLERRAELLSEWAGLIMAGAKDAETLLLGSAPALIPAPAILRPT